MEQAYDCRHNHWRKSPELDTPELASPLRGVGPHGSPSLSLFPRL